jgi:hypothetical protein
MDVKMQAIKAALGQFWDERAIPISEEPQSTDELGAPLDSLASMEVLVEIDRILERKVPVESVIRKGGYQTREQFIEDISTNALKFVTEHPQ